MTRCFGLVGKGSHISVAIHVPDVRQGSPAVFIDIGVIFHVHSFPLTKGCGGTDYTVLRVH